MHTPPLDHFGLMVTNLDDLHATVERAKRYAEKDDRVRIIDVHQRDPQGGYRLTNAYIGYLLPLMVELQHLEAVERT